MPHFKQSALILRFLSLYPSADEMGGAFPPFPLRDMGGETFCIVSGMWHWDPSLPPAGVWILESFPSTFSGFGLLNYCVWFCLPFSTLVLTSQSTYIEYYCKCTAVIWVRDDSHLYLLLEQSYREQHCFWALQAAGQCGFILTLQSGLVPKQNDLKCL